jgi:hypothetical protein
MKKEYIFADRDRYRKLVIRIEEIFNTIESKTIADISLRNATMNCLEELRSCAYAAPVNFSDELDELYAFLNKEQEICNPAKHLDDVSYYSGICCEAAYTKEKIDEIRNKREKG